MSLAAPDPSSPPRVACVVITYNRDDFVSECVASLLVDDTAELGIEVTVINNGATDNTAQVLAGIEDPRVSVRSNQENTRLALVLNDALEIGHASGADYILILNDDIEMKPGAIAEMVAVCREVPGSIVTPVQINHRRPDEIDSAMRKLLGDTPALLDDLILKGEAARFYEQRTLIGAALLAEPGTYRAVGDFDPIFAFYGLDDDYANRARDMGFPLLVAMRARMLHLHGKTEITPEVSKKNWFKRWSTHYQARAIFEIKSLERPFFTAFVRVTLRLIFDIVLFALKKFPNGSACAAQTLLYLLKNYRQISERRALESRLLAQARERAK